MIFKDQPKIKYPFDSNKTIYEILENFIDLSVFPSKSFFKKLGKFSAEEIKSMKDRMFSIVDIMRLTQMDFEFFILNAPVMKPRYFTIASAGQSGKVRILLKKETKWVGEELWVGLFSGMVGRVNAG